MLMTTHAFVGSTAGYVLKNPAGSFIAGVLLHFLADKIPHFWPESKKYKTIIMTIDSIVSLLVVASLFYFDPFSNLGMAWGALGGVTVDFILVGVPYFYKSKVGQWHTNRQPHQNNNIFWIADALIISIVLAGLTAIYLLVI